MTVTDILAIYAAVVGSLALALGLLLARHLRGELATEPAPDRYPTPGGLGVGALAPRLSVTTNTGRVITSTRLAGGGYLIAFFSSTCTGCRTGLPRFVDYAREFGDGIERVIAVVVGDERLGADLVTALTGTASVVSGQPAAALVAGYRVRLFPSYLLVDATGRVRAAGPSVLEFPQLAQRG